MRAWISMAVLVLCASVGCTGGGGCLIDSDCQDLSQLCIDRECVAPGTVRVDSGVRLDAGRLADAGRDAGPVPADAGRDATVPTCADASGGYTIGTLAGTCNSAVMGYFVNVTAGGEACQFNAASAIAGMPGLDGTFSLDPAGALTGTMSAGGAAAEACTGTLADTTLTITCGACMLTLNRV